MVFHELISSIGIRLEGKTGQTDISVFGYADNLLLLAQSTQDTSFDLRTPRLEAESQSLSLVVIFPRKKL